MSPSDYLFLSYPEPQPAVPAGCHSSILMFSNDIGTMDE